MKKKSKILWFRFFKGLLGIFFLIFFRPRIIGRENIPKDGGVILAGNHRHIFDPCMPILSTKRPVHYMAKKELFDSSVGWFFRVVGCIPVDRGHDDGKSRSSASQWETWMMPARTHQKPGQCPPTHHTRAPGHGRR